MLQLDRGTHTRRRRFAWLALLVATSLMMMVTASSVHAQEVDELADLDIEDLFDMEVTSLTKSAHKLSSTPAAIYVLTQEDLRRSGVQSIPEALRLVPGMQVARLSGNRWAISARGFNSLFSDKLLVLMDGREVYTPLFAGVYWDVQDTNMQDIERIEVIRGPGGTLWGANAVNGVVNIVTKSAKDTHGALAYGGAGNVDRGFATTRYGNKVGDNLHYRGYFKYLKRTDLEDPDPAAGLLAHDSTEQFRGGWRMDWDVTPDISLTFQGDLYGGGSEATAQSISRVIVPAPPPRLETTTDVQGGNILLNYIQSFGEGQEFAAKFYYDRTERDDVVWDETRDTWDIDLQHRFPLLTDFTVTWGGQYRRTRDETGPGFEASYAPEERELDFGTGFLQIEWDGWEDRLRVLVGSKFIYNDFTGFEVQPSARVSVTPIDKNTFWASFARAVRIPSRSIADMRVDATLPGPINVNVISGDPTVPSEDVYAFEAGYRVEPIDRVQLDIAGYYNLYRNLYTLELSSGPFGLPVSWANKMEGGGYGVEFASAWRATDWFTFKANYTWSKLNLEAPGSTSQNLGQLGIANPRIEEAVAEHQVQAQTLFNLPYNFEFDAHLYYVSKIDLLNVDDYLRLDLRLGYEPVENLEFSFAVQNLTSTVHTEWRYEFEYTETRIPRSYYGAVTWRY